MATGVVLKLKFDTMSGSRTWNFATAKSTATLSDVRGLANTMISNASLFEYQPVRLADARIQTTTENVFDLDS